MATIINMGGGSISPVLLASVTDVPTSSTAISGTENWKKYDAIYFECFMHYSGASDKSIFTSLILTDCVSLGDRYQLLRVYGTGGELNAFCSFLENVINISKNVKTYGITKLNIYGVRF